MNLFQSYIKITKQRQRKWRRLNVFAWQLPTISNCWLKFHHKTLIFLQCSVVERNACKCMLWFEAERKRMLFPTFFYFEIWRKGYLVTTICILRKMLLMNQKFISHMFWEFLSERGYVWEAVNGNQIPFSEHMVEYSLWMFYAKNIWSVMFKRLIDGWFEIWFWSDLWT